MGCETDGECVQGALRIVYTASGSHGLDCVVTLLVEGAEPQEVDRWSKKRAGPQYRLLSDWIHYAQKRSSFRGVSWCDATCEPLGREGNGEWPMSVLSRTGAVVTVPCRIRATPAPLERLETEIQLQERRIAYLELLLRKVLGALKTVPPERRQLTSTLLEEISLSLPPDDGQSSD